eukprot:4018088-Prymnesium_polylepis.1
MTVDQAKVQGFVKLAKTALKYWAMWPKDAKAEVCYTGAWDQSRPGALWAHLKYACVLRR